MALCSLLSSSPSLPSLHRLRSSRAAVCQQPRPIPSICRAVSPTRSHHVQPSARLTRPTETGRPIALSRRTLRRCG